MNGIKVLIAFVCGFIVAQGIKTVVALVQNRKNISKYIFKTGGMPSGHATSFLAATTCLGLGGGFSSSIFALAACMAVIILYDAVNVRYAVGEQGKALNQLISKPLRLVEGHTLAEVFVGGLLGVAIGCLVYYIL